jgi:glycosyltransferase involved in cell wall biosynthesis
MSELSVGVVIAVRDGTRYLGEALDSVLTQDPAPDEVVVVDDGSTDDLASVLEHYAPSVRCVRQEPTGLGSALNRGIAECRTDVLGFCDADDAWAPGKQAAQLAVLRADPACAGVMGQVQQFVSPELAGDPTVPIPHDRRMPARLLGAVLLRRAAVDRVGPFDERLAHSTNLDWFSRARQCALRLCSVDTVVLLRRVHNTNFGLRDRPRARTDMLEALRRDRLRRTARGASPEIGRSDTR